MLFALVMWLEYLNSCVNPLLYALAVRDIRLEARKLMKPMKRVVCCQCASLSDKRARGPTSRVNKQETEVRMLYDNRRNIHAALKSENVKCYVVNTMSTR